MPPCPPSSGTATPAGPSSWSSSCSWPYWSSAIPAASTATPRWLRAFTATLIGLITAVNAAAAVRLVAGIIGAAKFSTDANVLLASGGAIWLSNVIAFGLWYWDLDRGGAAARARGSDRQPAFVFPEMSNAQYVSPGWYPKFIDYLHLSFTTATAFSPTDVSAIKPWAKLMMMAEEAISLLVAILVVSRAVNILG